MLKSVQGSPTTALDDAELIDLCQWHEKLWRKWGRAKDHMTVANLMDECEQIARQIVGMPVFAASGLAAKRRVLRQADFCDPGDIVGSILEHDAARVAAR
jgi:hypothetical protein